MTEQEVRDFVEKKLIQGKGFDPLTIIAIISLIIQAWRVYQSCKVANHILKKNVERNGLASRLFFKKMIYDKLIENNVPADTAWQMVEELKKEFIARS